jgi:hypothetical protein
MQKKYSPRRRGDAEEKTKSKSKPDGAEVAESAGRVLDVPASQESREFFHVRSLVRV